MTPGEVLEGAMLIVFSISWCCSVAKMLRCKVSAGKSLVFVLLVSFGYCLGLVSKLWAWQQTGQFSIVTWIYAWNLLVTSLDAVLVRRYATAAPVPADPGDGARIAPCTVATAVDTGAAAETIGLAAGTAARPRSQHPVPCME